jgi:outer membrane protein OmpA-like peptidoglycan-associated protein
MKTRIFLIAICLLFFVAAHSQETTESAIIISEESLVSLIKKIREKRDAILLENEKKNTQQYSSDIKTNSHSLPESTTQQQNLLTAIYGKLQTLEYDIKVLNASLNSSQKTTALKESLTVVATPGDVTNTHSSIATDTNKTSAKYFEEISELENKITALKKEAQKQMPPQEKQESLNSSNNNYHELLRLLKSKITSNDTLVIEKRELSDYPDLVKKFDSFKSEVFFENNSKAITEDQTKHLDETVSILKSTEKIDVYLKGFASNKGNPVYNQNLSVQRTENVKKYLAKKGIHPSRILTQYHGIDYSATSEELARRVEISFLIRK